MNAEKFIVNKIQFRSAQSLSLSSLRPHGQNINILNKDGTQPRALAEA